MSQLTDLDESVETETSHGISRRTLVKGGLVAGGALWATPVVQMLGTRVASAASVGSGNAPSYVMLVLANANGSIFTVKVGQNGAASCVASPNNGGGGSAADQNSAFASYLTANLWTPNESLCSTDLHVTTGTTGGLQITIASGYSLVGYMLHDGQLTGLGKTATPTTVPSTWTVPALPAAGYVLFAKP